ncbi:MAG: CubicO group peptidase (beta-lactamase class C family) [Candidatus Azotimanducaceae bacterium]|jgi:CubicO group peptidase (beta-lactamase class C family)
MAFKDAALLATAFIDQWLNYQTYIRELPSLSVGIDIDGQTVFKKSFGYSNVEKNQVATPETLYRIASHSKLFTASAIMRLFAAGRLRLDDPIKQHLDWFSSAADKNLEHVTIRQLLSHSSGMNRDGQTAHWADDRFPNLDEIKQQTDLGLSSFETGEHWKYSNMGFTILGQVIEAVTGQTYENAVRALVIDPMGLKNTAPDIEPGREADHATGYGRKLPRQEREPLEHVRANVMNSATGFSSNVTDLIQFYRHHQLGNEAFLSDRDKREMQRPQFIDDAYKWGLGFELGNSSGMDYVGHGGGYPGFITYSLLCQQHKLVIVVLSNALNPFPQEIAFGLMDILNVVAANESKLTEPTGIDTAWLDKISGLYTMRWGNSLFQRIGNRMVMATPDVLRPSMAMSIGEQDGRDFRWVSGMQNGVFGESHTVDEQDGKVLLRRGALTLEPFDLDY